MRIKRFNENLDNLVIEPITFNNSKGIQKTVYPSVIVDFIKTTFETRDAIRKEMNDLMHNQGFSTPPKFVNIDGSIITSDRSVIEINKKYPGFKWVFFVEEKNLEKSKEIADKYGVDFYQK